MEYLKTYLRNIFRVLTVFSVVIAIAVFFTGKASLTENIKLVSDYLFRDGTSAKGTTIVSDKPVVFNEGTDNLLTTIVKTLVVILAIFGLVIASVIASVLETIIWVVSWGEYRFYCTGEIWNLCWSKIVANWFWVPSKSTYLWITFFLYSGSFGGGSVDPKNIRSGRYKVTFGRTRKPNR